jgi:hypothetical protein
VGKVPVDWVASNRTPRQLKAANILYTRRCNTTHKYTGRFYFLVENLLLNKVD